MNIRQQIDYMQTDGNNPETCENNIKKSEEKGKI